MKRILITGANSYIGTSFEKWVAQWPENYRVDTVGTRDGEWKDLDFSPYDTVFHVAGIAHIKENKGNQGLYFKINRDLAYEIANKAKDSKVKQFVFLSSMSVYGIESGIIDRNTSLNPKSAYGRSKMEAERLINELQDESFNIITLRPPMVYGKGCKGNYPRLAKIALKTPIFPQVDNKRSMIYIDNLSNFIKQLIDDKNEGVFFPQNTEYVNTTEMVNLIAKAHGKRIVFTELFNPLLRMLNFGTVNKLFGNLVYDKSSASNIDLVSFSESLKRTENI